MESISLNFSCRKIVICLINIKDIFIKFGLEEIANKYGNCGMNELITSGFASIDP